MNCIPSRRSLWVFDFDGTLSTIVADRNEARLHRECGRMLRFLVRSPWNRVAVLSSRALDDIAARVSVPGVIVGGGGGLEWQFPGGRRIGPGTVSEAQVEKKRRAVSPILNAVASIPGVEVEDKRWSVAVHYRNASPKSSRKRKSLLQQLKDRAGIKVYQGPKVVEVQLLGGGGKSAGVRRLCRLAGWNPTGERIVYAGDDENDAVAIRWVLSKGGSGIIVGSRITVPRALHVENPAGLARAVREFAEKSLEPGPGKCKGGVCMTPFEVKDCALLVRMSGLPPAVNLRELRDRIALCSENVLFHHFCETTLRGTFDNPDYRNDFAVWAKLYLGDRVLAERLGILDPYGFPSLGELRTATLEVIDERLGESTMIPWARPGDEFYFMEATTVVFDAGFRITQPSRLGAFIRKMTNGSVYYHFLEARRRPPVGMDDFTAWLVENEEANRPYIKALASIDFYFHSLPHLRREVGHVLTEAKAAI